MFSLVVFDNGEYSILPSKRIKIVQDKNCIVKYPGGANYSANLVRSSDHRNRLLSYKKKLSQIETINENKNRKDQKSRSAKKRGSDQSCSVDIKTSGADQPDNVTTHFPPELHGVSQIETITQNEYNKAQMSKSPKGRTDDQSCSGDVQASGADEPDNVTTHFPVVLQGELQIEAINYYQSCSVDVQTLRDNEQDNVAANFHNGLNGLEEISEDIVRNDTNCVKIFTPQDEGQNVVISISNSFGNSGDEIEVLDNSNFQEQEESNKLISYSSLDQTNDPASNDDTDSSYRPNDSSNIESFRMSNITNQSDRMEESLLDNGPPLDVRNLAVPEASRGKGPQKKQFCPFCKQLQTKFSRHLSLKHKSEPKVSELLLLPPKSKARNNLIEELRKKGAFLHNTRPKYNSGVLIVSRRRQQKSKNTSEDYVACKSCKGFYSKYSIRIHYAKCNPLRKKGLRDILSSGRRYTGYIHTVANDQLRRVIFPVLRDDDIVRCIRYDELIIKYGNKLCDRYTLPHHHDMIRAKLRTLGRFKLTILKMDEKFHELKEVFKPQNFDIAIKGLKETARWNQTIQWFEAPGTAQSLTSLLRACAKKLRTEAIKNMDEGTQKYVENFLLLWDEEVPTIITKKALEAQIANNRERKVILPSRDDIKTFYNFLTQECKVCIDILDKEFNLDAWSHLCKCTLVLIQIFNRRRAGEIERLNWSNYDNKEAIDQNVDQEAYARLSATTKDFTKKFVRLKLQGKLDRTVYVLLSPLQVDYLETIRKYRTQAGVSSDNPYIFSVPGAGPLSKKYLRACPLMRRFAEDCGALFPATLRGTILRKHIATYISTLNIQDHQIDRLADHMGHHKDIHRNIYRQSVPAIEIPEISNWLMGALGEDLERAEGQSQNEPDSSGDENSIVSSSDEEPTESTIERFNTNTDPTESSLSSIDEPISSQRPTSFNISKGKIVRSKWRDTEKACIKKCFGDIYKLRKLPSLEACRAAINNYSALKGRTPEQIKSWIDNQRRAADRKKKHCNKKDSF